MRYATRQLARPYSLAVLALHPVQYHSAFYRALDACPDVKTVIYYMDDVGVTGYWCEELSTTIKWDLPLLNGHDYQFLRNFTWNKEKILVRRINPGIIPLIMAGRHDAVLVTGYDTITALIAIVLAKVTRKKILFRTEADLINPSTPIRRRIKKVLLPRLLNLADAVLYSCKRNRAYFKHYGVSDEKLFPILSSVDNEYFQERRKYYDEVGKYKIREKLCIPRDAVVILYVGRLTDRKRPYDILDAFKSLGDLKNPAVLVMVGDGPLRGRLEQQVDKSKTGNIIFAGFKNLSEIPQYYACADIFVLPSQYDPTPKVINEAMNFRLPVVVSNGVGTVHDLVQDNKNGLVFNVGDVDTLASKLKALICDEDMRVRLGQAALETVADWSPEQNVEGVVRALEYVIPKIG